MAGVKIDVEVNYPEVDVRKTRQAIHREMATFTKDVLKSWVLASTEPVPVLTGAAKASWIKAAEQASTRIIINPTKKSRIPLGVSESSFTFFADPGRRYGWEWSSSLEHLPIVENRVGFIDAGLRSLRGKQPELPQPVTTNG